MLAEVVVAVQRVQNNLLRSLVCQLKRKDFLQFSSLVSSMLDWLMKLFLPQ
jgi:hypothetical protein